MPPSDSLESLAVPEPGSVRQPAGATAVLEPFGRDLWLAFWANFLFAIGLGLYYQLLNAYAVTTLGAPRIMIGVLVAIQLVMTALGYLPGAWAADRYRLKPIIVWIWWITVPTAISFALAPSWPWLIPGYVLTGLYMANNPAFKVFMMLKSPPERMARNISYVFAGFPMGMAVGPLAGGWLWAHYGMRVVFLVSVVFYAASSTTISLIRDVPYPQKGEAWSLSDLLANRGFVRNLVFFFAGFFAVYLGQPFVQPFLAQVHHQGPAALGVFAAIAAIGGSAITFVAGRATDLSGSRRGIGITLACIMLGALLLLSGGSAAVWGVGVFFYGAFDSFRFVTAGIMSRAFGSVPPVWGYAVFDASMGVPMAGGALVGGALYRAAYRLPFEAVIVLAAVMLVALVAIGRPVRARQG